MAFLKKVKSRWHDDLSRSSWQDFELLIAEYYRAQGYEVKHVGTAARPTQTDGGIDLKIYNTMGELIYTEEKFDTSMSIRLSRPAGLYILVIQTKNETKLAKLLLKNWWCFTWTNLRYENKIKADSELGSESASFI